MKSFLAFTVAPMLLALVGYAGLSAAAPKKMATIPYRFLS